MSISLVCKCYAKFRTFSSVMDPRCHSRWHRWWHQEVCGLTSPGIQDSFNEFYLICTSACRPLSIFANVDTSQLLFPSASLDIIAGWRADHIGHGRDRPLSLRTSWPGTALFLTKINASKYPSPPFGLVKGKAAQKTFLTTLCLDGPVTLLRKLADQLITNL